MLDKLMGMLGLGGGDDTAESQPEESSEPMAAEPMEDSMASDVAADESVDTPEEPAADLGGDADQVENTPCPECGATGACEHRS